MRPHIEDEDVQLMAAIAGTLRSDYIDEGDEWAGSPFAWIKTRPSRQVGKIGEQLIAGWCAAKGLDVTSSGSSHFDRVIHGFRAEIKFSTLWGAGVYRFQQIRDQDYDLVICLGVSPFNAHSWVMPKCVLRQHVIGQMGQHGGRAARDTDWISVDPTAPPSWITPWGGSLRDVYHILLDLGNRR